MNNCEDNFEWARRLECPPSALKDSAKKSLNQGIAGLLWDELGSVLHPTEEVVRVRKNNLLYRLKHGEKDSLVLQIRNAVQIESARIRLDPQLQSLDKDCQRKDFEVRKKQQQLLRLKDLRQTIKTKENLLRMKFNQMRTQVEDCKEMRLVCQHLMPATNCDVDPKIVDESLSLVSGISTRTDRKMAWNKISENLVPIEIPTLWNILLERRIRDTEKLIGLGSRELPENECKNGENMDVGIARACGEYVATAAQRLIHRAKANEHEQLIMEYIEKIETSEENSVDVSEWLALTLEVRKFETEQNTLQIEIDGLKKTLEQQSLLAEELSNLEFDIHSIDTQVEKCVQDIQKSLTALKPAGSVIARTKEKLAAGLEKIAALHSDNQNVNYLDVDLSTELNIFHDTLQLEALRKILLKDNVGAYRHAKCCISEASLAIAAPTSSDSPSEFPMTKEPIYHLLDCYKHLTTKLWLAELENRSNRNERTDLDDCSYPVPTDYTGDTVEILNATDLVCDRVREEIRQFDQIFDAWNNQTVQKAMTLNDSVVNGATYKEWVKRYDNLLYMVRRKK